MQYALRDQGVNTCKDLSLLILDPHYYPVLYLAQRVNEER